VRWITKMKTRVSRDISFLEALVYSWSKESEYGGK
jgi:hypothetical protein